MSQIVEQRDVKTSADNDRVVFRYWDDCVTSKASTLRNAVVNEHAKETLEMQYVTKSCTGNVQSPSPSLTMSTAFSMSWLTTSIEATYAVIQKWKCQKSVPS